MLQQYSYLREQIQARDAMLKKAVKYSEQQEECIIELRSYIEQFNLDIVTAMEHNNRDTGRPKYQKSLGGGGKPTLERMLSIENHHLFALYSSVVLID